MNDMGSVHSSITPALAEWIGRQHMFVVATAPLAGDGLVNASPKGYDTLRILDDHTVAYLDLTGSGIETTAHVRENGRIMLMWCAFEGPPRIVRVHGRAEILDPGDPKVAGQFDDLPGARSVILIHAERISDSCGYSVPRYDFVEERTRLLDWAAKKSPEQLSDYRTTKNAGSIDGLPGVTGS